uniref:Delta-like protein n=1 Tax=Macrostomum lignano TaxID=282301 RepID=A0A1I8HSG3_9PLAT
MQLIPGREYHQRGLCECDGAPEQQELVNGHIQCLGFALDNVSACRLCRYPPIAPLLPNRVSNIPHPVLEALRKVLTSASSPCHVVHAASPDREGEELRVSTSFLENRMLRSLSTLQGQLFVTLKYLVKKVICHKNGFNQQGLKSYHVKTITFRMVDETPVEQWKKENLVSLTRQSLQMLLDCVEKSREQDRQTPDTPDRSRGRIMNHFFLSDAAIYLKGADKERVEQHLDGIMSKLRTVIDRLPQLLQQFIGSLRPVSDSGTFYFHPFQILPNMSPLPLTKSSALEYYQIYDVESLTELIARLPDCALSAREALRALACLKFGERGTAERVVSLCSSHSVSRGIAWSREKSATEATEEFVMRHLRSRDSAWKFCFRFDQRPKLEFLAGALRTCFPLRLSGSNYFYMNFDALLWALRLELRTDREARAQDWIRDVAEREDSDEQELQVAVFYSSNPEQFLVGGTGYMRVQFHTYYNHDSRASDGTYCDTFFSWRESACDPKFQLFADRTNAGGNNLFNYGQAGYYGDLDIVNFGGRFGEIANPVVIDMPYWNPGSIQITVVAMDKDEFYDDHMDHFYASLPARADSVRRNMDIYSSPRHHRLSITYWYTCHSHYYGLDCNTLCKPRNDSTGHYTCDSNGNKVCMSGWMGTNCTRLIPCLESPCYNGGTCSNVGNIANCTCTPNFNGSRCETDVNECELDLPTCSNGGTCLNTYGGFDCVCPENSTGSRCEDLNECALDIPPCQNNGTCINTFGGFNCSCPPNFNGSLCETDVNECDTGTSLCLNGGTCINTFGRFNCSCPSGFTGSLCGSDVNECASGTFPCQNGGTCLNTLGGFNCSCPPNFNGSLCETDVNECDTGTSLCLNGGTCINTFGGFNCSCPSGFTGSLCGSDVNECASGTFPCQNGGTCLNTIGGFNCSCPSNFTGARCEADVNECENGTSLCLNGGTCQNTFGGFSCLCPGNFTGSRCEADADECKISASPCGIGGTCLNTFGGFNCICAVGLTGSRCEIDVDECEGRSDCASGSTCVNEFGSYRCQCPDGFSGRLCETAEKPAEPNQQTLIIALATVGGVILIVAVILTVVGITNSERISQAVTSRQYSRAGYGGQSYIQYGVSIDFFHLVIEENYLFGMISKILNGFEQKTKADDGKAAVNNSLTRILFELSLLLLLAGVGVANGNGYMTLRFLSYINDDSRGQDRSRCDHFDKCDPKFRLVADRFVPGGRPVKHKLSLEYWYSCNANYYGLDCNTLCVTQDDKVKGHYNCSSEGAKVCLTGWTGADCTQPDLCNPSPCLNGATCSNVGGVASCSCPSGFTGSRCETDIDECKAVDSPCLNNATCENTIGSFRCKCSLGFTGERCETDVNECESKTSVCLNNGTCENTFGGFNCSCPPGLTGHRCELDVDECANGVSA